VTRPAVPYWHVDAFADGPFAGNQAAVMPLDEWLPDDTLQAIGAEIKQVRGEEGQRLLVQEHEFLAAKLAVAKSFEDVRIYSDGDAVYAVTVLVARV